RASQRKDKDRAPGRGGKLSPAKRQRPAVRPRQWREVQARNLAYDQPLPDRRGSHGKRRGHQMLGLEANGVYGPFSAGGEYTHSWIGRKNGFGSLSFHGWYGEAAWTLTGESRKYKEGKFFRVEPTRDFNLSNGG